MKKCDVTINKGLTINAGNYESLRPDVSVTFKDIDVDKIPYICEKMDDLVSDMLFHNIMCLKSLKKESTISPSLELLEKIKNDIMKGIEEITRHIEID